MSFSTLQSLWTDDTRDSCNSYVPEYRSRLLNLYFLGGPRENGLYRNSLTKKKNRTNTKHRRAQSSNSVVLPGLFRSEISCFRPTSRVLRRINGEKLLNPRRFTAERNVSLWTYWPGGEIPNLQHDLSGLTRPDPRVGRNRSFRDSPPRITNGHVIHRRVRCRFMTTDRGEIGHVYLCFINFTRFYSVFTRTRRSGINERVSPVFNLRSILTWDEERERP